MADDQTEEALRDIGKDLKLSPPEPDPQATPWWIYQLNHSNQVDALINSVQPIPSLAPVPDQEAKYLVDGPTQQLLDISTRLAASSTAADGAAHSGKRKGNAECQNTEHADYIGKHEDDSSSEMKKKCRHSRNQSEKNRRAKINEQFQKLQELIPPGNTASQASLLERAVTYIKSLKVLLKMLSMMSPENAKAIQEYHTCA